MTDVPVPTAEGSLSKTPFGHVLLYIVQHNLTGTLVVWPEDGATQTSEDRLFLRDGYIIAARVAEAASTLERGVLPLFMRSNAPYAFYKDVNLLGSGQEIRTGRAHPFALFAASLRGASREDAIDAVLGKLHGVRLRIRPGMDLQRFEFQPRELQFLEVLRAAPVTPEEVATATGFPEKAARRLLYLLVATKSVEPYTGPTGRASVAPGSMTPGSVAPLSGSPSMAGFRNPWSTASSSGAIPGASTASRAPMPNAASRAPAPPTGAPPIPGGVKRSTNPGLPEMPAAPTIGGATQTAGQLPSPSIGPPSTASLRAALRASKPPAAQPPANLTPEQKAFWQEVLDRTAAIENQTYFQMLGVPSGSAIDRCREAYFELVKKFHPDRLGEVFKPIAGEAQDIFRYITEAHDTLTDESKRERYMEHMKEGGGTPASDRMVQNMLEASMEFQKAEVLMRRRDYDSAISHARAAATLHPQEADYHAFIGWCLHLKYPDANAPVGEMLMCLDRALELEQKSDKIHHWRGVVLRRMGRDAEAIQHFEKAAALNPRNVEALREVRIAKMRGQTKMDVDKGRPSHRPPGRPNTLAPKRPSQGDTKPETPSGGGLFGGLFNKKKS